MAATKRILCRAAISNRGGLWQFQTSRIRPQLVGRRWAQTGGGAGAEASYIRLAMAMGSV